MASDLHQRVGRLPLEDKVRLLTGRTGWVLHAAAELGLLPITVSDGSAGVRGTEATQDEHSAGLPSPTAVAAAWDTELMERAGRFFAAEARRKDVDVVLAPVLNLHRSPAGGRHFECLSEDPHLIAELTAPSADAGIDIVMPGPDGPWGRALVDAGRAGEVERVILREIGSRGHVLLRSEGDVLPLSDSVRTVALIGPNAVDAHTQGGGSAHVNAKYRIDPAEGLREVLPEQVEVTLLRGGDPRGLLPVVSAEHPTSADLALYDGEGEAIDIPDLPGGAFHVDARERAERAELVASLTLTEPGTHRVEVAAVGAHTIRIDDEVVSASAHRASVDDILESRHAHPDGPRVEIEVPEGAEPRTVSIDVAIVVVGTNDEVESEGYDRPTLDLPGNQGELVRRVCAANPNTVVVVNAGATVLLPWLDEVPAVLWTWFGGQE